MTTKIPSRSKEEIRAIVMRETLRHGSVEDIRDWAQTVAACTRMQSGFFGVRFTELLPVLDEMCGIQTH